MDGSISFQQSSIDQSRSKIVDLRPLALAFNGKRAAKEYYGHAVAYGLQGKEQWIEQSAVFVLPSTSGVARRYWDESYWKQLADFVSERC